MLRSQTKKELVSSIGQQLFRFTHDDRYQPGANWNPHTQFFFGRWNGWAA
jgi:hypothetical protein